MRGWVPPHCLVDVDVVNEEGYELAKEKLQLKQNAGLDWQLGDLAVLQGHDRLGGQWGAGEACSWTAPGGKEGTTLGADIRTLPRRASGTQDYGVGSEKAVNGTGWSPPNPAYQTNEPTEAFPIPTLIQAFRHSPGRKQLLGSFYR